MIVTRFVLVACVVWYALLGVESIIGAPAAAVAAAAIIALSCFWPMLRR